ncbi:hypothetical protein FGO68_gene3014 [Halteria grandinella]|uniref:Transmembrane protein n=1 Tax=Halteria grandinella TaxID=5974 RepID=A0A8J8NXF4_HALGN|nr:hypothetical protein FGO68_gene3014 [Halteria grandinella]
MVNHMVNKCPHFIICCQDCEVKLSRDAFPIHDCEKQKQLKKERDEYTKRQREQRIQKQEERESLQLYRLQRTQIAIVITTWILKDILLIILPFVFFFHPDYQYVNRVPKDQQNAESSANFELYKQLFLYSTIGSYAFSIILACIAGFQKIVDIDRIALHIISQNSMIYRIDKYNRDKYLIFFVLEVINSTFRVLMTLSLSGIAIRALGNNFGGHFLAILITLPSGLIIFACIYLCILCS